MTQASSDGSKRERLSSPARRIVYMARALLENLVTLPDELDLEAMETRDKLVISYRASYIDLPRLVGQAGMNVNATARLFTLAGERAGLTVISKLLDPIGGKRPTERALA